MRWPSIGLIASLSLWVAHPAPAIADSWAPPTTTTTESPDRQHRFTMTPRALSSSLAYFEDAVKEKPKPGQLKGQATSARGHLERRDSNGRWVTIWDRSLVNDVAPVDVVVAPSGRTVATFDNWHFVGRGENVLVFYGPDGELVRSLKLSDLLPEYYISALPHSVSSTRWRKDPRFAADGRLIIPIVLPTDDRSDTSPTVELTIDPMSGAIIPVSPSQWTVALEAARRVARSR